MTSTDVLLVPSPQTPASADMVQSVNVLDRSIKQRRESDTSLINWWLYTLLVGPVTFHIYTIVLFFKRIAQ